MELTLKVYLAQNNMTLRDFAKKLECTEQYMSDLGSGRRFPSKRLARDILQATNGAIKLCTKKEKESAVV